MSLPCLKAFVNCPFPTKHNSNCSRFGSCMETAALHLPRPHPSVSQVNQALSHLPAPCCSHALLPFLLRKNATSALETHLRFCLRCAGCPRPTPLPLWTLCPAFRFILRVLCGHLQTHSCVSQRALCGLCLSHLYAPSPSLWYAASIQQGWALFDSQGGGSEGVEWRAGGKYLAQPCEDSRPSLQAWIKEKNHERQGPGTGVTHLVKFSPPAQA